jgi:hypothetical protein
MIDIYLDNNKLVRTNKLKYKLKTINDEFENFDQDLFERSKINYNNLFLISLIIGFIYCLK